MIRIAGVVVSHLRDDIPADLIPMDEIGEDLAERMRQRVHDQGVDADGRPWSGGRDFVASGQLRDSLGADGDRRSTVITYADTRRNDPGRAAQETNQEVARRVFSDEAMSPLQPSASEIAAAKSLAIDGVTQRIFKTPGAAGGPRRLLKGGVRVR